jgi:2-polyprenyl-6-methoxyphenol hydroxylase-like FAD-dependent oxidoreductase
VRGAKAPRHYGAWASTGPRVKGELLTRARIVEHLRQQITERYSTRVAFADDHTLVGGSLREGRLRFEPAQAAGAATAATAAPLEVSVDLVVLADGAGSRSRAMLQAEVRPCQPAALLQLFCSSSVALLWLYILC